MVNFTYCQHNTEKITNKIAEKSMYIIQNN